MRRLAEAHGVSYGSGLLLPLLGVAIALVVGGGVVLLLRVRRSRPHT